MMHPKQSAVQQFLGKPTAQAPSGTSGPDGGGEQPRPVSAVKRYLRNGSADGAAELELPAEEILERKSYCILRGRLPLPPMFRLINRQGRWRSFDYASLTGASMDTPQHLLLHYEGRECYTLTLSGFDLDQELAGAFDDRRVLWVKEFDELTAIKMRKEKPGEPVVSGIRIAKGMASREW